MNSFSANENVLETCENHITNMWKLLQKDYEELCGISYLTDYKAEVEELEDQVFDIVYMLKRAKIFIRYEKHKQQLPKKVDVKPAFGETHPSLFDKTSTTKTGFIPGQSFTDKSGGRTFSTATTFVSNINDGNMSLGRHADNEQPTFQQQTLPKFKAAAQQLEKSTKTVAALKDTRTSKGGGSSSSKDERKCSKSDDDKSKRKDEKSGDKKDKDISEQKSSSNKTSQKDDKEKSSVNTSTKSSSTGKQTTLSRNLWVSGLSSLTRASDLKTIFSKYGKVIGAKVVTNTRTPGTRCYGYVTMSSTSDASRCIEHLHHTELHGRIISVEHTKNEIGSSTSVAKTREDTTKKE
ncbi:scaffold attachment factor B1-like [Bactrocera neohumeralis]|uniref:scaffold attachment factor B1-like n=1 Tax=Bactrocera neohumeralis TaxID=98809 RepID=UPI002164F875|nr:scaffold attachment factor B1-like [Bactrocera neohumeralis]